MLSLAFRGALGLLLLPLSVARADKIDSFVESLLKKRHIAGLSVAVIEDGQIVKATAYGFAEQETKNPVTTNTLFQAGSISKPVAALGALHLVEQNKLSLDEDVNTKLRSWKVPENEFTKNDKVTLRRILSHNAGLTVHGFPGYGIDEPLPTLVEVLDGGGPANTKPIRVDIIPGSKVRYSGGGFTVMQQLVIDVSGEPFARYMSNAVLVPLGMTASTFAQPPPLAMRGIIAQGYYANGKPVVGKWHVYPEMAAAGLWTTPSDLARFVIALQQTLAGNRTSVLSQRLVREMLSPQAKSVGLGLFLNGEGKSLRFEHNGRDEGFDAQLIGYAEQRVGAVLMINSNDDTGALLRIVDLIAREYHWPH